MSQSILVLYIQVGEARQRLLVGETLLSTVASVLITYEQQSDPLLLCIFGRLL
jgi:hypothetical protein